MTIKLISWDEQETLTGGEYGDRFWLEILPRAHAKMSGISDEEAKAELGALFKQCGEYDKAYYDTEYWLAAYDLGTLEEAMVGYKPTINDGVVELLEKTGEKLPMIALSATTHSFLKIELSGLERYFESVTSTINDLGIAGKPVEAYREMAERLGMEPREILHIGDHKEMDVENAQKAGWQAHHWTGAGEAEQALAGLLG